jgi:hypothetical protein
MGKRGCIKEEKGTRQDELERSKVGRKGCIRER